MTAHFKGQISLSDVKYYCGLQKTAHCLIPPWGDFLRTPCIFLLTICSINSETVMFEYNIDSLPCEEYTIRINWKIQNMVHSK